MGVLPHHQTPDPQTPDPQTPDYGAHGAVQELPRPSQSCPSASQGSPSAPQGPGHALGGKSVVLLKQNHTFAHSPDPQDKRIYWIQRSGLLLGPHLPHAPGSRMTVVVNK